VCGTQWRLSGGVLGYEAGELGRGPLQPLPLLCSPLAPVALLHRLLLPPPFGHGNPSCLTASQAVGSPSRFQGGGRLDRSPPGPGRSFPAPARPPGFLFLRWPPLCLPADWARYL
jgi:hypothetical protein